MASLRCYGVNAAWKDGQRHGLSYTLQSLHGNAVQIARSTAKVLTGFILLWDCNCPKYSTEEATINVKS